MQDDSSVLIALGVAILAAVFVVVIVTSVRPDEAAIREAIASGRVTYGMSEKQVIQVWGEPDTLEPKVTTGPLGKGDQLAEFFKGLSQSRLERALAGRTLYTYTIWTYRNPWRTVTFDDQGHVVVDWFPKD